MSHIVYRLQPAEYHRYRTHLLALDEESRYLRFGYHIKDETIDILCDKFESNTQDHKIFVIEDENLVVIGAGHIARVDGQTELAFSVLKEHQGQGMGSALMKRIIEWCQNRGIKDGCMVCLSTNSAIKKLAKKYGVLVNEGPETLAGIRIPDLDSNSIINEVVESNIARMDHLGKLQRRFTRMLAFPLRF
jgi:GNAT superfamily N-acetyltransferase